MKLAVIYGGQGSQKVGIGKDFYEQSSTFKKVFDLLTPKQQNLAFEGPIEELSKTENIQPIMTAYFAGITDMLKQQSLDIELCAGLSLGEYSALYLADVFTSVDLLKIVTVRGQAMAQASIGCDTTMMAILGSTKETIEQCIVQAKTKGIVEIANYNCPGQIVIAGDREKCQEVANLLIEHGAKRCIELVVSGPFHTSFMQPASVALDKVFQEVSFHKMSIPVVFNTLASTKKDQTIQELLMQQVQSSVQMQGSIEMMIDQGIDTFIEIGQGKTIAGFIKKINRNVKVYNIENQENFIQVMKEIEEQNENSNHNRG